MRPGCTPYVLLTGKSQIRDITLPQTPNCRIVCTHVYICFSPFLLHIFNQNFIRWYLHCCMQTAYLLGIQSLICALRVCFSFELKFCSEQTGVWFKQAKFTKIYNIRTKYNVQFTQDFGLFRVWCRQVSLYQQFSL